MSRSERVDVFVSYRHREPTQTWVRQTLVPALEADGLSVLLDVRDFVAGELLIDGMEQAASRARVTVAVVDQEYRSSGFTDFERDVSHHVVALLLEDVPADRRPPADATIEHADADVRTVVDTVRSFVKHVFVLEAREDREWVEGVLLPVLERADIAARHSGDARAGETWQEYVERETTRADRIVVVLSKAYLRDVDTQTADKVVRFVEAQHHVSKTVPIRRGADLEVPPRFEARLIVDADAPTETVVAQICRALEIAPPSSGRPPPCPYPGMRPFTEDQSASFFGRDSEIAEVVAQLRRRRFAPVVGPSGSGKSSMVAAGVAARLQDGALDGAPAVVELFRPGARPTAALRAAASRLTEAAARSAPGTTRVLVIDQLEEAFAAAPADATMFFDEVASAHRDDLGLAVIVTLRADFTGAAMEQPALWPLIDEGRVDVVPLRGSALHDAIRLPAQRSGVVVESALVERLVAEVEGQPGLLPFLQETLRALWDRLDWRLLSLATYGRLVADGGEASGVTHAIGREAAAALAAIGSRYPDGVQLVRATMVRLVQFGEGARNTRRQVDHDVLAALTRDTQVFANVYEILVEHRLLTPGSRRVPDGPAAREIAVVDLSHEAIIEGWPQLQQWLVEDRTFELTRRQWAQRAAQHREGGASLLVGSDLTQAEAWLADAQEHQALVEAEIRDFVAASRAQADRVHRRRQRWLVVAAVAGLALTVTFALLAQGFRRAQQAAEQETDRRVATELQSSAASYEGDITLQALLARAADVIAPTPLSALEMLGTAEAEPPIARRIDAVDRTVGFEAVGVVADAIVVGDGGGQLFVYRNGESAASATTDLDHGVMAIVPKDGTSVVAVGGGDAAASGDDFIGSRGWVDLVDLADPSLTAHRIALPTEGPVSALAFRGDDLFIGSWDGYIGVVDTSQPSAPGAVRVVELPPATAADAGCLVAASDRKVRSIAMDDGGQWLAAGTNDCGVAVWDLTTLTDGRILAEHTDKVRAVAFVPGSTELLSTGDDGTIRSWDLALAEPAARTLANPGRAQRAVTMCVSPDAGAVVVAGRDHRVRRYVRTAEGALQADPAPYRTHVSTVRGVLCESPTKFASVAGDGVALWDLSPSSRVGTTLPSAEGSVVVDVDVRPGPEGEVVVATPNGVAVHRPPPSGAPRLLNVEQLTPKVLAYSPDGRLLAVGGRAADGQATVLVFDAASLTMLHAVSLGAGQTVSSIDVLDSGRVVAGTTAGTVAVVDGATPVTAALPTGREVVAIAIGTAGDIVVGDVGGTLLCASSARPQELTSIELGRPINDLSITDDGTVLAGTSDGALVAYPEALATPQRPCRPEGWTRATLPVLHDSVVAVDAGLGGSVVLAANSDGTAELWDRDRTRLLGELSIKGTAEPIRHVAMAPDGSRLVIAGASTVIELVVDRTELRDRLCRIAGRDMTPDEEATFLREERYRDDARCTD